MDESETSFGNKANLAWFENASIQKLQNDVACKS